MMKQKNVWIHVLMVVLMLAVGCVYMSPALGGKIIRQGDIEHYEAMAYSQKAEKQLTGKTPHWNSAMFSGMPGYQITNDPQKQVFQPATGVLTLRHLGLDRNIGVLFLYLLGFYVALIALGLNPWLALIGALGFGLGSYNIIIIQAGHITKAWALGMMAPVLAGMVLALKSAVDETLEKRSRTRRVLWGSLLFTFALTVQIAFNHIQITLYTAIACLMIGIAYLVVAIKRGRLASYGLKVAILVAGAVLAFGCNVRLLMVNEEYVKYTMRGGGELTIGPDGQKLAEEQVQKDGLDINYAYNWSYGIGETYTLLVPGALGGSNNEPISADSEYGRTFHMEQAPLYWGGQPGTSGPVYFGAIVMLLFVMGMMVTKGPERWWILAASVLAIMLSWGSNLMGFNEWAFNHVPLYNKFRTPSMALVLANVCMALLAALTLKAVFDKERDQKKVNKALYIATGALGVLILGVMVASGSFGYSGSFDARYGEQSYGQYWQLASDLLKGERAALLKSDSWRSLIFILLTAAVLWLYNNEKIKKQWIAMSLVGVLIVVDLWGIDRRYLNDSNYVEKEQLTLKRQQYDYDIDQQAQYYGDHDYRVFNLATDVFNDAIPSAFHDQIGGYSPAKLNRYQDLISFHIGYGNQAVLNMLNMRYVVQRQGNQAVVMRNPDALGNAWFVGEVKAVGSADEEIMALRTFDPARTAVVDTSKWKVAGGQWDVDSAAVIKLVPDAVRNSDYIQYESQSAKEMLAVFSEIHYAPDWRAYIDGEPAEYIRANYVLRAMVVPAGKHVIEFKNEAPRFNKLENIGVVVSIVTLLIMAGAIVLVYWKRKKKEEEA